MNKIHTLPPHLVSKIAAGEVIERPSYAVKELLENALDAQASEIKIYLEEGGMKKILVVDNGEGMSEEDVKMCWKPHTTSKLTHESELQTISSLGFRGEALSSLASVSTLTVQSRPADAKTGYLVTVSNNALVTATPVGMPQGTMITVDHLFGSLPARRKFITSIQKELRLIVECIHSAAIAHPSVRFVCTHNKKLLFDWPAATREERIEQVLGSDTAAFFLPVAGEHAHVTIAGYIAKPQRASSSPYKHHIFVNARHVHDRQIASCVKEAYGTLLESTSHPIFVLFISVPYELVDVNVHPRKEQISFLNIKDVLQGISHAVARVLSEHNLTFEHDRRGRRGVGLTNSVAGALLKNTVLASNQLPHDNHMSWIQFKNLYIVVSSGSQLLIVDQHAAHERILFEKLKTAFLTQQESKGTHKLSKPVPLVGMSAERLHLDEHKDGLMALGFRFRGNAVTHMPALLCDRDPNQLLTVLLEDADERGGIRSIDRDSEEMLAFLACRAAVKAGDTLTAAQMKTILEDLAVTPNSATCPHGRPTTIRLSSDELDPLFKR